MGKISKSNIEKKLICFGIQPTSPEIKYGYILSENITTDNLIIQKIKKLYSSTKG